MRKDQVIAMPKYNEAVNSVNITEMLRLSFEYSSEAIAVLKDNFILMCNPAFCHLFGYKEFDATEHKSIFNFISLSHHNSFRQKLISLNHSLPSIEGYQIKGIRKDGTEFDIEMNINFQSINNENFIIISARDITEKKKILNQINKLSRIVDQSSSIIIITDLEGKIEYTNPKFTEVTGYFFEEVYGKKINFLKSGYTPDQEYKELWERILSGKEWRGEFKNKKKNGEYYWESATISPIKNENGEITHFLAIKEDITEKKEMEFELKRALDSSEEASRLKSTLLSNMSHELRTPLTGIIGFASLLRDELNNAEHVDIVDKILKSGKRLLVTLNSILNLSEIESGTFPININEFNLGSYTKYFLTNYDKTAAEKSLSFNIEVLDEEICAVGDENLFKQILMHLVDNALKFTQKGGVKIQISSSQDTSNNTLAIVKVIDTGIGIAKEDQTKIFREFRQLSEGIRRNFEGSGLGLAVARKMAKLMNGDITVESELGKGSTFSIILPGIRINPNDNSYKIKNEKLFKPVSEKKNTQVELKSMPSILSIEDNLLNAELVSLFLRDICIVDSAYNYSQAVEKIQNKKYAAILVDINLGNGPSGIDFAKEVRKFDGYKNIPLIAITGYALLRDEKKLLSEGFNYYLAKPYDREDLIDLIIKAIKCD